jgi:hypothetical protein
MLNDNTEHQQRFVASEEQLDSKTNETRSFAVVLLVVLVVVLLIMVSIIFLPADLGLAQLGGADNPSDLQLQLQLATRANAH